MNGIVKEIKTNKGNLIYLSEVKDDFEKQYNAVRDKEKHIYSDAELKMLPAIDPNSIHNKEWGLRAQTLNRMLRYFKGKPNHLRFLEVGCGNGWFSNQISLLPQASVIGIDINEVELTKAVRVFQNGHVSFCYGDIFEDIFESLFFDVILLNASIQYFPDFDMLINRLIHYLSEHGEIHISDSPFYKKEKVHSALQRSHKYYETLDTQQMSAYYYHRNWHELKNYKYKIQYNPVRHKWKKLLGYHPNIFPWIIIRKVENKMSPNK